MSGIPDTSPLTPEDHLMDIHKPKPWHNLREFAKEYIIIVLGVATALIAEQAVEWWHWHERVGDAVEAMTLELRDDDGVQVYARAAAMTCFERQLDGIRAAIEAGRPRAEINALIGAYHPPVRTWDSNAWDSMVASGVAAHVPPGEMMKWSLLYTPITIIRTTAEQERTELARLQPTRLSGDRLSTSEADTMLAAAAQLRNLNHLWALGGPGYLGMMEKAGIAIAPEQKNRILGELRALHAGCAVAPAPLFIDPDAQFSARPATTPAAK